MPGKLSFTHAVSSHSSRLFSLPHSHNAAPGLLVNTPAATTTSHDQAIQALDAGTHAIRPSGQSPLHWLGAAAWIAIRRPDWQAFCTSPLFSVVRRTRGGARAPSTDARNTRLLPRIQPPPLTSVGGGADDFPSGSADIATIFGEDEVTRLCGRRERRFAGRDW